MTKKCPHGAASVRNCKSCAAARSKARHEAHREEDNAYLRAYRKRNRSILISKAREKYWNNPEAAREMKRRSMARDPEKYRARCRDWYRHNRTTVLRQIKDNRTKRNEQWNRWARRNPEKTRDRAHRSKFRRRAAMVVVEKFTREEIYLRDKRRCRYCGRFVRRVGWHLEHIIPIAKGGQHRRSNVAVSCAKCNLKKGVRIL